MMLASHELEIITSILDQYVRDAECYLFGSRANDTAKPGSDVDLLVKGKQPMDLALWGKIEEAFADSDLPYTVDIVDWHRIDAEFKNHISKHSIKL